MADGLRALTNPFLVHLTTGRHLLDNSARRIHTVRRTFHWMQLACLGGCLLIPYGAFADDDNDGRSGCKNTPGFSAVQSALTTVVAGGVAANSGLGFNMWATVVNRDGVVCVVTFSGADRGSQWPGSRVISAQKANTANAFSLPGFALSAANFYS